MGPGLAPRPCAAPAPAVGVRPGGPTPGQLSSGPGHSRPHGRDGSGREGAGRVTQFLRWKGNLGSCRDLVIVAPAQVLWPRPCRPPAPRPPGCAASLPASEMVLHHLYPGPGGIRSSDALEGNQPVPRSSRSANQYGIDPEEAAEPGSAAPEWGRGFLRPGFFFSLCAHFSDCGARYITRSLPFSPFLSAQFGVTKCTCVAGPPSVHRTFSSSPGGAGRGAWARGWCRRIMGAGRCPPTPPPAPLWEQDSRKCRRSHVG